MPGKKHACSSCGKKFASAAAMQQHFAAAHKSGPTRPRKTAAARSSAPARNVMKGTDILIQGVIGSGFVAGRYLQSFRVTPRAIGGTRLKQLADCWARWKPKQLCIRVVMAGSAMTYGSVLIGWTPDVSVHLPEQSSENIKRVASCMPNREVKLNSSVSMSIPVETSRKWYLTSGPLDDISHGSVAMVIGSNTGGYTGSLSYTVHMDWTVEFEGADLESNAEEDDYIGPDAGWESLFTTSDSSFAEVLTFKMTHGGSMVPFSSAHPARIYTLVLGTTVPYFDKAGVLNYCQWFVRVQKYNTPGLLLFATREDAQAYITSGDISKALPYYSPCGNHLVTPTVPKFKVTDLSSPAPPQPTAAPQELEFLRRRVHELERVLMVDNSVRDDNLAFIVRDQITQALRELVDRPSGSLTDPVNVFVTDPVAEVPFDNPYRVATQKLTEVMSNLGVDPSDALPATSSDSSGDASCIEAGASGGRAKPSKSWFAITGKSNPGSPKKNPPK